MPKTLLLTRAKEQAKEFALRVEQDTDYKCRIAPMQKMQDLPAAIDFSDIDALVFTSKNGVESFVRRWADRDLPAYCVGPATAELAKTKGFVAHPAAGNAASLSDLVNEAKPRHPLHVHGIHKASGLDITGQSIAIYEQIAMPLDKESKVLLKAGKIDAVAIFSQRSARLMADAWQNNWPKTRFFCISDAAAAPLENIGETIVCQTPDAAAMVAILKT